MLRIFVAIIFCGLLHQSYCQTADQYLDMANKAYTAQKLDDAKNLYKKAAKLNSAEAYYQLAYKFVLTDDERFDYLLQATKAGHEQATFDLFQEAFRHQFNFDSLAKLALNAYEAGKKKNPKLDFIFMNEDLATMQHCIEVGPLDMDLFLKKNGLSRDSIADAPYGIWQLAAKVSQGKLGKPEPKLILQLACRDGFASAEKTGAVKAAYDSYKAGKVLNFKVCDYITSGYGQGFCAKWQDEEAEALNQKRIKYLKSHLKNNAAGLLQNAYTKAITFFDAKANREEGSGGSGRSAWITNSIMAQKTEYLDLIERADSGKLPLTWSTNADADKKLNDTYRQALKALKLHPISDFNSLVSDTDIVKVQQLWIPYRDATAKLLFAIMPAVDESKWQLWLTAERTTQLKHVIEMVDIMNPAQH